MDITERTKALAETRLKVWNEAQGWLEKLPKGEEMSAEQREQWGRYNERIDGIAAEIGELDDIAKREREAGELREAQSVAFGREPDEVTERRTLNQNFRAWIRGEKRMESADEDGRQVNGMYANINAVMREKAALRAGASPEEVRALAWDTGSVASAVPTLFDRSLYEVLEANIAALRMPTTRITTDSGASMEFPKVTAHAIATQVSGQGTALAGTDPTFGKLTLTPSKYGELIKVAEEVITDNGVDIVTFLARDLGRAVGRQVNTAIVANMVAGACTGAAGTVATGGTLIDPTYETLIDVEYGINDAYRSGNNTAWLMRDATAGVLRKLRDGAGGTEGAPLWQPSLVMGVSGQRQPDRLLSYPVFTDPGVASLASNAKVMFFGDWSAYYLRTVGNPLVQRNDSVGFDNDEVHFRGKWRAAGGYQDDTAVVLLKRSVS